MSILNQKSNPCPHCFKIINRNDVRFQCMGCKELDEQRTEFENCRPLEIGETANTYEKVFQVPATNFLLRLFGKKNPHKVDCPACGQATSVRVCPECHSPYPYEYTEYPAPTIAIVGAKETGKSHYIAVLIEQLRQLEHSFQWSLMALNESTPIRYNNDFKVPLYEKMQVIPPTQTAGAEDTNLRNPLLYQLAFPNRSPFKTYTLAFFDTAGEDMNDHRVMQRYTPYIYNASGIILLLDPLQQKELRNQLPAQRLATLSETLRNDRNTAAGEITERLIRVITENRQLSRNKKIDIPLAVVFSKIDEFHNTPSFLDSLIYHPSKHKGYFNRAEFNEIDEFVRGWIGKVDSQFMSAIKLFKDVGFFGISALGQIPEGIGNNQKLKSPPRPIRVEDPFLWLSWKNGLIQGR